MNYAVRLVITDIDTLREVRSQTLTLTGADLDEAKRRYDLIESAQRDLYEADYDLDVIVQDEMLKRGQSVLGPR